MTVLCWDCKDSFQVAADMEGNAYRSGEIKRFREGDQESPWMGLCPRCKVIHARADDPTKTIPFRQRRPSVQEVHDDTALILLTAIELREDDLELSREDSIHRAVDLHFAPEHEPHPVFREYLKWRDRPRSD